MLRKHTQHLLDQVIGGLGNSMIYIKGYQNKAATIPVAGALLIKLDIVNFPFGEFMSPGLKMFGKISRPIGKDHIKIIASAVIIILN